MSPAASSLVATSPVSHGDNKSKGLSRVIGGATSGALELILFHPVDTISKRLMSNQGSIVVKGDRKATLANMNRVVFRHTADQGALQKYKSMFPGLGFAAGYKIAQRTYKFGGQPFVMDFIDKSVGSSLQASLGPKKGKVLSSAMAGSLMGIGEVLLLPLDVLKIKAQTNPDVLKGRGLVDIFRKEGRSLYKGGAWTAARNAPGSFALFGGASAVQYGIFKLEDPKKATFWQNFFASIGGAVASITVAAPLDVVKTRIQNKGFDSTETGVQVIRNLVKNEGFGAFFKGLTPKIIIVGPKLVFSFTIAQSVMNYLGQVLG
ncbi:hypothetical protein BASA81_015421 [Batrachochytrium salamandrivorans]|nr:hypothetical protein BASA81_015421 [Batrachochytrium salamandrivorans]